MSHFKIAHKRHPMTSHHRLQCITHHLVGANTAGSAGAYGPVGTKRDSDVVSETPRAAAAPLRPPLLTRAVVFSFYFSLRLCVACCLSLSTCWALLCSSLLHDRLSAVNAGHRLRSPHPYRQSRKSFRRNYAGHPSEAAA